MGRCESRLGLVAVIVAVFTLIMSWGPGSGTVRANGDAGAVFTAGPDMTVARMAHHNLSFPDGSAMVLGGHGTGFKVLDGAEQWHPTSNSFSMTSVPSPGFLTLVCCWPEGQPTSVLPPAMTRRKSLTRWTTRFLRPAR